jgi:DNA-binding response OmpR family regulator
MPTVLVVDASGDFKHLAYPLRAAGFRVCLLGTIEAFPVSELSAAVVVRFQSEIDSARETCLEIRRVAPEVPLMVISPRTDPAIKAWLLDLGADDYLEEPFAHEELIARLRSIIRRQSRANGASV